MAKRSRKARLFPRALVGVSFTSNLSRNIELLAEKLRSDAYRGAAYAGIKVFYDEMQLRVPVGETGNLKKSLYHYYVERRSSPLRQLYATGPNVKKAPHWALVEFGHYRRNQVAYNGETIIPSTKRLDTPVWVSARSYIRSTFDSSKGRALEAARLVMIQRVDQAIKGMT